MCVWECFWNRLAFESDLVKNLYSRIGMSFIQSIEERIQWRREDKFTLLDLGHPFSPGPEPQRFQFLRLQPLILKPGATPCSLDFQPFGLKIELYHWPPWFSSLCLGFLSLIVAETNFYNKSLLIYLCVLAVSLTNIVQYFTSILNSIDKTQAIIFLLKHVLSVYLN